MAKANPLKKITAEAKRIRRAHPGKSWKNAVKEAGQKYRTGKIGKSKPKKKAAPRKKARAVKRTGSRKRASRSKKKVTAIAVREVKAVKVGRSKSRRSTPARRMAGSNGGGGGRRQKSNVLPILLAVGAGLLLWQAFKGKQSTVPVGAPPLITTSNTARNQQTSDIVAYAAAAGLALDAISRLIEKLNSSNDNDVRYYYDEIDARGTIPPSLFV